MKRRYFDAVRRAAAAFGDRSFPDAAFVVETGASKDQGGKTLQKFRHLPHHTKGVESPTDNTTVDLPHLRNALARCGQVQPVKENAAAYRKRARGHLEAHARALLKNRTQGALALCEEFGISIFPED